MFETRGGEQITVLIVEDEVELAELFAAWLEQTYTVKVAHDCMTAYKLFDETVDVALLDRELPDGYGEELLAELRSLGLDWRVAMVTGIEPDVEIIEMGFDEYLCKPVSREELQDTVERLAAQANYGDTITESYRLASKKALLKTHCSQTELANSEEYAALEARIKELDKELNQMVSVFSDTQIMAEFTSLSP